MRILITGSKGFTGRYLEQEFAAAGWEVFGLGVQPGPGERRYCQLDLDDSTALCKWVETVRPDAVAHLAAISFVAHEDASAFYRVNMLGTRNLLEALAAIPRAPSAVLLASSANVYGRCEDSPITERSQPAPTNDYAVSKLGMEYLARLYVDRLPLFLTRPFNYTGVGQSDHFLVPKIVRHFAECEAQIELGNLDVSRDFSDVRAVVRAYRGLIEKPPVGEVVNICSGQPRSIADILSICTAITGHSPKVVSVSHLQRMRDIPRLWGSNDKLRSLLPGWTPLPLEETLSWMLLRAGHSGYRVETS